MSNHHNCRQKDNNHAIKAGLYDSFWQCYLLSQVVLATQLTDKGTLTRRRLNSLSACVCVFVCSWHFRKPQQIRAEQVPIDWPVENRDLRAAVHSLHTLLRWMLYRYRGLQKLVLADEEKQEFCDLWIDFLRLMWKMSHKANIKVIIFLQGLTSNLC